MDARLIALSGLLEGGVFPLEGELSIGRERANAISVEDRMLSRRHCLIQPADKGQFCIVDLNSSNGTYVNGLQITERVLEEGDQIKTGDSLFLFTRGEAIQEAPAPVELDAQHDGGAPTLVLKREDAVYLRAEGVPASGRTMRNLEVLLKIASTLASVRGLEPLQRKVVQSILEVIPAGRGVVLLGRTEAGFTSAFQYPGKGEPLQVSRSLVDRVMSEEVALVSNNVLHDAGIDPSASLINARICSVLIVPLISGGRTIGAIYLDSQDGTAPFQEDHLQLLTGIAGIAAAALENALMLDGLQRENHRLQAEANIDHDMVGRSARMRSVFDFVAKVAPTTSTVLIRGESGTGKELVARAIHRNSARSAKPFVAINCAALTETLLESELFGHERGAFTGAVAQKKGKLEEAAGGSVFLDELGELAPALQAKLLRVLQEREFERVGGTRPIKADIRLIGATNRDLEEAVRNGGFRRDLYYRLNVVSVVLPALRDRREDILPLATHFVRKHAKNSTRQVVGISEEARVYLAGYDWPGNVRELENAMERAVVLGSTELILPDDLPDSVVEAEVPGAAAADGFHEMVREAKKQIVLRVIDEAKGNYSEAAKRLRLHPSNLHRLIRTLNLREELSR